MKKISFMQLGWVVAAALGGILLGGGFQGSTEKFGVVDIAKVVEDSNFGKQNQESFKAMKAQREGILEFMDQNRVMTVEQAQSLRTLTLKPNPTAQDKAKLATQNQEVQTATKKYQELQLKQSLTPEERNLMTEYAQRAQKTEDTAQQWYREFTGEMQSWADKQKVESLTKARAALKEAAKAGSYTIVYEIGVAPYGANDVTDAALKAMNAMK